MFESGIYNVINMIRLMQKYLSNVYVLFAISTGSPLNRRSKCGTALVEITRVLVFLGLKSAYHSFGHSLNLDKSLLISYFIIS